MSGKTVSAARSKPTSNDWRKRLSSLRYVPQLLKLAWEAHFGYATAIVVLRLIRSFVPVATLWVGKLIIDTLVMANGGERDYRRLLSLVLIEILIVLLGDLLFRASGLIETLFRDIFNIHVSVRVMEHAATLDLNHFEDPSFYDRLERAREEIFPKADLLGQILSMIQDLVTLLSLGWVVLTYNYWLSLLIAVAVLPGFLGETYFTTLEYLLHNQWTAEHRELYYLCNIGAHHATVKEVQLFGFSPWLVSRFRKVAQRYYNERKRLSVRKVMALSCLSFVGTLGYYAAYTIILVHALEGVITLGKLTLLAGSILRARDSLLRQQTVGSSVS